MGKKFELKVTKYPLALLLASCLIACAPVHAQQAAPAFAQTAVVVAVPAHAGAVYGTTENSDAFVWRLFTEFAAPASKAKGSPAVFETWASDEDTFSLTPHWPDPAEQKKLQTSVLQTMKSPSVKAMSSGSIDVGCSPPVSAALGGFPSSGSPTPCIAEEVRRNRPQFDYIVNNNLNTQAGLASAFARSFKVDLPFAAIAVKADWVPVQTMLQWLPQLGSANNVEETYYTVTVSAVKYALVSLHVSSKQNANWVWGTFEHRLNPGRCDSSGCFDSFGAEIPAVAPNKGVINSQYGDCPKTQRLKDLMAGANMARVWENYCLKATQVDYVGFDGTPSVLGNSVTEGIVGNSAVSGSSCITCHFYASFGPNGKPLANTTAVLPFNPAGKPIPAVLDGSLQFDFMWGVLLAK
jgi:hypothetical protein